MLTYEEIRPMLLKMGKRSEKYSKDYLVNTFVDSGFTELLLNPDNQIIYGRRGTGKTHLLGYLGNLVQGKNDLCIEINMQCLGSTGSTYNSSEIPITERATRLLVDTLTNIHEELYAYIVGHEMMSTELCTALDKLATSSTQVYIEGDTEVTSEQSQGHALTSNSSETAELQLQLKEIIGKLATSSNNSTEDTYNLIMKEISKGKKKYRIHFGSLQTSFKDILTQLPNKRVWILIDEWSDIPLELQAYLADMLRRTIFPISNITVKIAAIEQKTRFKVNMGDEHIGLEVGGDASANLNLDNLMIFNNNKEQSKEFFSQLIYNHAKALLNSEDSINSKEELISIIFNQKNTFEELVKAAEGVSRDAINILVLAVIDAVHSKISINAIRRAAKNWYSTIKEKDITNPLALRLLRWIIDEVIGQRKARAFLLKTDVNDSLINDLFDARVLHIIKNSVSAKDRPGERFKVYQIDYGCYVDLINTSNDPKGLFQADIEEASTDIFVDVPSDDYRSIRRAILDLDTFYSTCSSKY